ncbi:MAG: 2-amino-4-hydroxy-6-hydroxymethyldihydropteridine diphosphokinase [Dehalococcoidia bacterium]|nr:2-amino-4-hydroxy-6-hydroxymethyldihydropteridine diphosphokinase [Dehalococcoidia bacterium]
MTLAYLGLGSNLGDRRAKLRDAVQELRWAGTVRQTSSLYETEPIGFSQQPRFLNAVCAVETGLSPHALLRCLKRIERRLGRRPARQFGPRCIDIDILLYGDQTVRTRGLMIPHSRLGERAFVLVPLRELIPELLHPVPGSTVTMLGALAGEDAGVERIEGPDWSGAGVSG